ncbi:ABC transporter ATP-binding protein [Corynebacterium glaucum]|uniref:ABC transporter ATP-binding protein n=2 Tax=Corynebacterium glaucum TaxID=187491 RepID=UPI000BAC285F|nr:ABC transporter ATP-binding protein [Corynebacterium glaucum]
MKPDPDTPAVAMRNARARILQPVSFTLPRGSITALVGPSGSGKTTLMRMIVGTQARVDGTVHVLGLPAGHRQLRTKVTYATQQASVFDELSVRENLSYVADIYGLRRNRIDEVVGQLDLTAKIDEPVRKLSGGQRSRVSLAVALLPDPELVVLDEPTVGLDPILRTQMWDLFKELAHKGTTLIISSHILDEAEHCENVLFIRDGKVSHTHAETIKRETGAATLEAAFVEAMTK